MLVTELGAQSPVPEDVQQALEGAATSVTNCQVGACLRGDSELGPVRHCV